MIYIGMIELITFGPIEGRQTVSPLCTGKYMYVESHHTIVQPESRHLERRLLLGATPSLSIATALPPPVRCAHAEPPRHHHRHRRRHYVLAPMCPLVSAVAAPYSECHHRRRRRRWLKFPRQDRHQTAQDNVIHASQGPAVPPRLSPIERVVRTRGAAGAADVHHVIEVVDDLVDFAVVVACVVCHMLLILVF